MNNQQILTLLALLLIPLGITAKTICMSTPSTSLVVNATEGQELQFLYYGAHLSDTDVTDLIASRTPNTAAYPVFGFNCDKEAALSVRHDDGDMTLQIILIGQETKKEQNATVYVFKMKDKVHPFYVNVCYRTYNDVDIIESWTEITNEEKHSVTLTRFDSAVLPIRKGNVWLSHLYGSWANEAHVSEEPLKPGMFVIENKHGLNTSHTSHAEVMFSLNGKAHENEGDIIGAALCYAGNYKLRINTHDDEYHQLFAGINEENSEYHLERGETFTTPALALTYSHEGLSGASRNFHRWGRKYKLMHGNQLRKILLNSWEGVYFDINEQGMNQMMADIADMGGELFVMDDGWFGGKYQRNKDNSSLGDWVVDTRKLPHGIEGLLSDAKNHGIKFGIWLEPEMSNTISELYEKHPEWVLKPRNREAQLGRGGTQVVLDLTNPKVQDFVFSIIDNLMTKYPEIDYIKWDSNMGISNCGSQYLPTNKQSHLYIEYRRGLDKVCQRIRAKYPNLTIQACASGGGRANWGFLPYFDEFWTSDNTDALQRIYMQWGTSYFFPAIAMASHISAAPNHQTFRRIPLKYRIDVAMSGRLGLEIQPKNMTDEEKELCKRAVADYKTIRPVVQLGDIYRLVSPYDHLGLASLMYVSDTKDKAAFFWWKTEHFYNQHLPRVKMAGLDPNKLYRIKELVRIDNTPLDFEGKTYTGAFLMANGLEIPYNHNVDYHKLTDYASRVLYLEAVN